MRINCSAILSSEINLVIFLLCFSLLKIKEPQFFSLSTYRQCFYIFLTGFLVSSRLSLIDLICREGWCFKWMPCSSCSSSGCPLCTLYAICFIYTCHTSRSISWQYDTLKYGMCSMITLKLYSLNWLPRHYYIFATYSCLPAVLCNSEKGNACSVFQTS